jgi:hypothetical protein
MKSLTTDADRAFARDLARRIYEFHRDHGHNMSNHYAENLTYEESLRRSILTECAFAHEFDLPVNTELLAEGDGGQDFRLTFDDEKQYKIDVKTKSVHTSFAGLLASGTHLRVPVRDVRPETIYVFGIYFEPTDEAHVLRWQWGNVLIDHNQQTTFKHGSGVKAYLMEYELLLRLEELKQRIPGFVFKTTPNPDPMPEPLDLQKLVEAMGGYDKITGEQWKDYDYRLERTKRWLLERHRQQ